MINEIFNFGKEQDDSRLDIFKKLDIGGDNSSQSYFLPFSQINELNALFRVERNLNQEELTFLKGIFADGTVINSLLIINILDFAAFIHKHSLEKDVYRWCQDLITQQMSNYALYNFMAAVLIQSDDRQLILDALEKYFRQVINREMAVIIKDAVQKELISDTFDALARSCMSSEDEIGMIYPVCSTYQMILLEKTGGENLGYIIGDYIIHKEGRQSGKSLLALQYLYTYLMLYYLPGKGLTIQGKTIKVLIENPSYIGGLQEALSKALGIGNYVMMSTRVFFAMSKYIPKNYHQTWFIPELLSRLVDRYFESTEAGNSRFSDQIMDAICEFPIDFKEKWEEEWVMVSAAHKNQLFNCYETEEFHFDRRIKYLKAMLLLHINIDRIRSVHPMKELQQLAIHWRETLVNPNTGDSNLDKCRQLWDEIKKVLELPFFQDDASVASVEAEQCESFDQWILRKDSNQLDIPKTVVRPFTYLSLVKTEAMAPIGDNFESPKYVIRHISCSVDSEVETLQILLLRNYKLMPLRKADWISGAEVQDYSGQSVFFLRESGRESDDNLSDNEEEKEYDILSCRKPFLLCAAGLDTERGKDFLKDRICPQLYDRILIIVQTKEAIPYIIRNAQDIGFEQENIVVCDELLKAKNIIKNEEDFSYIYVGHGNPVELMEMLSESGLSGYIRSYVRQGKSTYIGDSAGIDIVGTDLRFYNIDKCPGSFKAEALHLFEGIILSNINMHDLIRCCYKQSHEFLSSYATIGAIDREGAIAYDPEMSSHFIQTCFKGVYDFEELGIFHFLVEDKRNSKLIICKQSIIEEYSSGDIIINDQQITIKKDKQTTKIYVNDTMKIVPIYYFICQKNYYAFRLFNNEIDYIDMVFCFE